MAHVRSGGAGTLRGTSVLDRLAARIAFGVLAVTTFGAPLSFSASAGAAVPTAHAARSAITTQHSAAPLPVPASNRMYAVQPGDSLWRIADEIMGDGADWTALAALNLGRDVGGGNRFVDPDQLREGWHLPRAGGAARQRPRSCSRGRNHNGVAPGAGGPSPRIDCPWPGLSHLRGARPPSQGTASPRYTVHRRTGPVADVVGRGSGRGDTPAPLRGCAGASIVRGCQLSPGTLPGRPGVPPHGPSGPRLGGGRDLLPRGRPE